MTRKPLTVSALMIAIGLINLALGIIGLLFLYVLERPVEPSVIILCLFAAFLFLFMARNQKNKGN